jgi:large subunit ribosomal protein L11
MLRKAAGIDKGSRAQKREKVGSISKAQLREIATAKMRDLNAADVEAAERMIEGSARSMGIEVRN